MLQFLFAASSRLPLVSIHLATLLFGLAGVLGAAVGLNAIEVTFGRTLFASIALAGVCFFLKTPIKLAARSANSYLLLCSGVLLAFHWVTFFAGIQYSTVAIGLVTFSTCPVFVSLLEPIVFKERFSVASLIAALFVLLGVIVISGVLHGQVDYLLGIVFGIASGLSFAILQLLNRRLAGDDGPLVTSLVQNGVATLLLLPLVAFGLTDIKASQWMVLMLLGVACTAIAHTLFISALKRVSVSVASLIAAGLEPVYGVILAAVLLQQLPSGHVVTGGSVILLTVALMTVRQDRS